MAEKLNTKLFIGKIFNQWIVKKFSHTKRSPKYPTVTYYFICQCSCGALKTVALGSLLSGASRSCRKCTNKKHGLWQHPLYNTWNGMKLRCLNEKHTHYKHYGARGIKICKRWLNEKTGLKNFISDMGKRPKGYTLDRINNDGNYEPSNCRWATASTQQKNKRQAA